MIFPTKRKGIGYNDTTPGKKAWSQSLKKFRCKTGHIYS
jgi:hypothetical protein